MKKVCFAIKVCLVDRDVARQNMYLGISMKKTSQTPFWEMVLLSGYVVHVLKFGNSLCFLQICEDFGRRKEIEVGSVPFLTIVKLIFTRSRHHTIFKKLRQRPGRFYKNIYNTDL